MAQRMTVTLTFKIVTRASEAEVGAHIDRVMGELVEGGALDPAVRASLAAREAEVAVDVVAKNHRAALESAYVVIARAIQQAGGQLVDADRVYPGELPVTPSWSPLAVAA